MKVKEKRSTPQSFHSRKWWWWKWGTSLLLCKFKRFLIRWKEGITKAPKHEPNDVINCCTCRKSGHMMAKLPDPQKLTRQVQMQKSMCATWDEIEESEFGEDFDNEETC